MPTLDHPRARRSVGTVSARMLLVLTMVVGALSLTVVGAEPAGAASAITMTSPRLSSIQVHSTLSVTLRSNGDVTYRVESHNTARTRKYVNARMTVESPAAGNLFMSWNTGSNRIDSDDWRDWEWTTFNAQVAVRWDDIVNDPDLVFGWRYDVKRVP